MKIAIPGTGGGARPHTAELTEPGHEVFAGTRDPRAAPARTEPDTMGNAPYGRWPTGFGFGFGFGFRPGRRSGGHVGIKVVR
ncbi:hypothetical protein [Streptomyces sp. NPDC012888]|uniref:hypothetical protein n=1 Tax=Streptomyces sp. NPDC012888 TaxID=3364855 RepID=UPI00368877B6